MTEKLQNKLYKKFNKIFTKKNLHSDGVSSVTMAGMN